MTRITYKSFRRVEVSIVRENTEPHARPKQLRNGGDVADLVRVLTDRDPREQFLAIYLDTRHRLLAVHRVSLGTIASTVLTPREVFGPACSLHAAALIIAHNHPSGDPSPSAEDRKVTERMREAGELLGIECLDHIVIGDRRYYSFAEDRAHAIPHIEEMDSIEGAA